MSSVNLVLKVSLDVTCMRKDTFSLDMDWTDSNTNPIDLTAYTFKAQVRQTQTSASALLTFDDSDFTKDASGNLTMEKSASDMSISAGNYFWDLQATKTSDSSVETWAGGLFIIQQDITE